MNFEAKQQYAISNQSIFSIFLHSHSILNNLLICNFFFKLYMSMNRQLGGLFKNGNDCSNLKKLSYLQHFMYTYFYRSMDSQ